MWTVFLIYTFVLGLQYTYVLTAAVISMHYPNYMQYGAIKLRNITFGRLAACMHTCSKDV